MAKDLSSDDHILMEYNKLELLRADLEYEHQKELKENTEQVTEQVTLDLAKELKKNGVDINIIIKSTGLSKEVIESL